MELGLLYPERLKFLEDVAKGASQKTFDVPFQGGMTLNQFIIPLGLPKYRLINGRTLAAQAEYLAKNSNKAKDLFSSDPESEEAISIQHQLLKALLDHEPLLEYFKINKQTQPLILTYEGYVLNGNRRLCAMRELFKEDKTKFSHFENITIVILPRGNEKALAKLETELQIRPDIKAKYTWATQAIMMRRRKEDLDYSDQEICQEWGIKTTAELKEKLDMLAAAEDYLKSRGKEGFYSLIEADEFAFQSLSKGRSKILKNESEHVKEQFEKIVSSMLDEPGPGRLYEKITDVAKNFPEIEKELVEELGEEIQKKEGKEKENEKKNLLKGTTQKETKKPIVIKGLGDQKKSKEVSEIITAKLLEIKSLRAEKRKKNFVVSQITRANTLLIEALNQMDHESMTKGVSAQIKSIEETLKKIKSKL